MSRMGEMDKGLDGDKITGVVTLQYGDVLAFRWAFILRIIATCAVAATGVLLTVWFVCSDDKERALFFSNPVLNLLHFWRVEDAVWLGAMAFYPALVFLAACLQFLLLAKPHRQLRYDADAEALVVTDAAGVSLTLPWRLIKRVRPNKRLLIMQLNPRGYRYAPWRAFSPEDRDRLLALAQKPRP